MTDHTDELHYDREKLEAEWRVLRQQHKMRDEELHALSEAAVVNSLLIQKLKREKLQIKDRIARLETDLFPDQPA